MADIFSWNIRVHLLTNAGKIQLMHLTALHRGEYRGKQTVSTVTLNTSAHVEECLFICKHYQQPFFKFINLWKVSIGLSLPWLWNMVPCGMLTQLTLDWFCQPHTIPFLGMPRASLVVPWMTWRLSVSQIHSLGWATFMLMCILTPSFWTINFLCTWGSCWVVVAHFWFSALCMIHSIVWNTCSNLSICFVGHVRSGFWIWNADTLVWSSLENKTLHCFCWKVFCETSKLWCLPTSNISPSRMDTLSLWKRKINILKAKMIGFSSVMQMIIC